MESDLLRLILLVLGVLLVVGIYLWDRYKRITRRFPRIKMDRKLKEPGFDLPERDDDVGEVRVVSRKREQPEEPFIPEQTFVAEAPQAEPTAASQAEASRPQPAGEVRKRSQDKYDSALSGVKLDRADQASPPVDPLVLEPRDEIPSTGESQFTLDLGFNAHTDSDYLNIDPALLDEVPRLIVQINVMSRGQSFSASQVQHAAAQVELRFGEMSIYHRETDAGQVLFSMASVVEPGTFPRGKDEAFATPGLTLFTQLPGVRDGLAIYSDMLFTAERLSALLDAVLQDETRSKLTKQSIEHTREGILEHRRQIQLLRSRH